MALTAAHDQVGAFNVEGRDMHPDEKKDHVSHVNSS
jgi:hypothetical protein